MYVIKVKDKDEYLRHGNGYVLTDKLEESRTFVKKSGASNAINYLLDWIEENYEIVEVEIKIK